MTNINQYIEKYCIKHEVNPEVAKTHAMVKAAAEYYKSINGNKIYVSDTIDGCSGAVSGGDCK